VHPVPPVTAVAPVVLQYVPRGHGVGYSLPIGQKLPKSQGKHSEAAESP